MKALAILPALAAALAIASAAGGIAPFSTARPGAALPAGWKVLSLPKVRAPEFALVADEGSTVLQSRAQSAAGTVTFALDASPAELPVLSWRWKVDRVLERADLATRAGDDFAARVYVFFDVPAEELPMGARMKIFLARAIYGREIPAAALCYVWDNRHPPGTTGWNPYTDRVRTVVLRSGSPGAWAAESRDLDADFRSAFGSQWTKPTPHVTGIAVGNDTDQTGESVTAWFGDFRLGSRP
jgi:hypothetical protein